MIGPLIHRPLYGKYSYSLNQENQLESAQPQVDNKMIMKKYSLNPVRSFFFFLSLMILFLEMGVAQNTTSTIPVNVGVVLDFASLGAKIALSCINMALSDFYASHGDYKLDQSSTPGIQRKMLLVQLLQVPSLPLLLVLISFLQL